MREIPTTVFEAVDGKRFDNAEACAKHEEAMFSQLLKSLNPETVRDALKQVGLSVRADRSSAAPAPLSKKDAAPKAAEVRAS